MIKEKYLALPKGVTIQCPACGLLIARLLKDLYKGDTLHAHYFEPLCDGVYQGEKLKCGVCSADYMLFGKIFTRELGWLPQY